MTSSKVDTLLDFISATNLLQGSACEVEQKHFTYQMCSLVSCNKCIFSSNYRCDDETHDDQTAAKTLLSNSRRK